MTALSVDALWHGDLIEPDLGELRRLFDSEYLQAFGSWDSEQPYGYASHDVHLIARIDGRVVGHAGWARREIAVGRGVVAIAGVGGVLISEEVRGQGLGVDLMGRPAQSMRDHGGITFGYLGCREQVVPFYVSCGWVRIAARERSIGRDGEPAVDEPGQPLRAGTRWNSGSTYGVRSKNAADLVGLGRHPARPVGRCPEP